MSSTSLPVLQPQHNHKHDHSHKHEDGVACCSHHQMSELQSERYMTMYFVGFTLLVVTFLANVFLVKAEVISQTAADIPAIIAAIMLGAPLFYAALKELRAGHASSSSLAALALLGLFALKKFEAAGWVALILLFADQILRRTAFSAQRVIEQLVQLTPDIARLLVDGQEREVPLGQVKVGDVVRVRAGENLPIDGVVASGRSTLDQASLTGEAAPHEVQPGDQVYAGTTNLSGLLDIRVTQVGTDTTIGKVTELISAAEKAKTPRQLIIEQVARFYVPVVLSMAFLTWFLSGSDSQGGLERAVNVLFVACPSALLISSPTALVAAFAAAARLGIMIKEARFLEAAASIDTVVMDKTGTITTGRFAVSRLAPATGVEGAELLAAAANGEQQSNHPLAKSIISTANAARIALDTNASFEEIHGRGVKAVTSTGTVYVGRATWLEELFPHIKNEVAAVNERIEGMTGVHVVKDSRYLGCVGLEDKIRPNTKGVIDRLRELGVKKISIFTGDRLSVAQRVGVSVGADSVEAECLPAEKHEQIEALVKQGRRVLMVGDGINDGPSLAAADVGVAMGLGGSDIATNSAGVALMNDDLSRIPFMIELSRMVRGIIAQNIAISITVAVVGLALASAGYIDTLVALLFHFVGDVLVVLNSFRLFRFGEAYAEAEPVETDALPQRRRQGSANLLAAQPA
ncbi:MAG: cation-translocating P-type ATPase [Phycisphaerales bacterium]|nr:cation-translocating P-type ATPase [Phycisphaerales bacterium]